MNRRKPKPLANVSTSQPFSQVVIASRVYQCKSQAPALQLQADQRNPPTTSGLRRINRRLQLLQTFRRSAQVLLKQRIQLCCHQKPRCRWEHLVELSEHCHQQGARLSLLQLIVQQRWQVLIDLQQVVSDIMACVTPCSLPKYCLTCGHPIHALQDPTHSPTRTVSLRPTSNGKRNKCQQIPSSKN